MRRDAILPAALLALGTGSQAGAAPDARHGEELYGRCMACHALAQDRVGPRHCGLIGRKAGSVPGFAYSPAMRGSRIVWNEHTLARFLAAPQAMVRGSTMTYDGVADAQDRADLIAYLAQADRSPACANKGH
jgi:cytochrome c